MKRVKIPYEYIDKHVIASAVSPKEIKRDSLELEIPEKNLLAVVNPLEPAPIADVETATMRALENPVCGPKLSELIGPDKSLVIITDNQFRPTPTSKFLKPVLDVVKKVGVKEIGVAIAGMMVSHEVPLDEKMISAKLGAENVERIYEMGGEIWQNTPRHMEENVYRGRTDLATPVWVNKKLMRFDVKLGISNTHASHWGYGGGDRLGLAMCSALTIESNHRYSPPLTPAQHYGAYTGPMQKDILQIARMINYDFCINTIVDTKLEISDVNFGMLPYSHVESVKKYNNIYAFDIDQLRYKKADIVICGTFAPTNHIFFHTCWGIMSADLICRDGGTIIYCSPVPGYGPVPGFALMDLMKPYMPPTTSNFERVLAGVFKLEIPMWTGCIWIPVYETMTRKHVTVVTNKENLQMAHDIGIDATDSLDEAFKEALRRHGSDAQVVVLPYARYQLPWSAVKM
ncbi:MAG: lactate racemase domain-containing protein [Aigarchaeota archaeon]|nr:lactate racemase domain-containing protein [Aigarchaeota archaeon]MDW8092232.1 lactate racemase domain-containing protein [Nitrososphaerota archaeon]